MDEAGLDGKAAVDDAVQHGVLTLGADGFVCRGIPSFHEHLREKAGALDVLTVAPGCWRRHGVKGMETTLPK